MSHDKDSRKSEIERLLPLVDGIVNRIGRKKRLGYGDLEELRSRVYLRLVKERYSVLRRFEGRSTLETYLFKVIYRVFCDQCRDRWRDSRPYRRPESRRRDHSNRGRKLVARDRGRAEQCVDLENGGVLLRNAGSSAEIRFLRRDYLEILSKVRARLRSAIGVLHPEDRQLLWLVFEQRVPVAQIGRDWGIRPRVLYGRIRKILSRIRQELNMDYKLVRQVRELLASGVDFRRMEDGGSLTLPLWGLSPKKASGQGATSETFD